MRTRRQNIQLELALEPVAKGEAPTPKGPKPARRTPNPNARKLRRTAVYGPVRTVVWEGRSREAPPYPDCATALRVTPPQRCGLRHWYGRKVPFGPASPAQPPPLPS